MGQVRYTALLITLVLCLSLGNIYIKNQTYASDNVMPYQPKESSALWSMGGGDLAARNQSSYNGIVPLTVKRKYVFGYNSESMSPVVGPDGTIYVQFNKPTRLGAYRDGELAWIYEGTGNGGIHGSPVVDGEGNVYFVDWNPSAGLAQLISLDPEGNLNWARSTNNYSFSSTWNQLGELIITQDGTTIGVHGYGGAYQMVNKDNLWWKSRESIVGAWDGSLPGYNWIEYNRASIDSEGNLYLPGISGFRKMAYSEEIDNFVTLWGSEVGGRGNIVLSPDEETVYRFNNGNGTLYAISAENGSVVWSRNIASNSPWSQTNGVSVTQEGDIFVTNDFNGSWSSYRVWLYDSEGNQKWERSEGFAGQPFVSAKNGVLYGIQNSRTSAVDKNTGVTKWSYVSGWPAWAGMVVLNDGASYTLHTSSMYEYRPWTTSIAQDYYEFAKAGGSLQLKAISSMLEKDPGTSEVNQLQVILDGGDKVSLNYDTTDAEGNSIWVEEYTIPLDTEQGNYEGTIEASTYNTITDIPTSFDTPPTGSNNTGIKGIFTYTVDNTSPTGSVLINNGKGSTKDTEVELNISATDNLSGVVQMMISDSEDFSGAEWEAYSSTKVWSVSSGDGEKIVYIKFKDGAGNISSIYSDSILMDTVKPELKPLKLNKIDMKDSYTKYYWTSGKNFTISGEADKGSSVEIKVTLEGGVTVYTCTTTAKEDNTFTCTFSEVLPSGYHKVVISATDEAGNKTEYKEVVLGISVGLATDTGSPAIIFVILGLLMLGVTSVWYRKFRCIEK